MLLQEKKEGFRCPQHFVPVSGLNGIAHALQQCPEFDVFTPHHLCGPGLHAGFFLEQREQPLFLIREVLQGIPAQLRI